MKVEERLVERGKHVTALWRLLYVIDGGSQPNDNDMEDVRVLAERLTDDLQAEAGSYIDSVHDAPATAPVVSIARTARRQKGGGR